MNKVLFFLVFIAIASSCKLMEKTGSVTTNETGQIVDARDNRKYAIVKIGEQWWMAENLDYNAEGSYYYKDSPRNAQFYGRLYTYDAAKNSCPAGWHLPTDAEWMILESTLGMPERLLDETDFRGSDQGKQLLVKGSSGFNAMLGGYRTIDGSYDEMDGVGTYWTASEQNKFDAWGRGFQFDNSQISRRGFAKGYAFSVRCVRD